MNFLKKTISILLISIIGTFPLHTLADDIVTSSSEVTISNPYECDSEELQAYIQNKMESLEKGSTAIEKWSVFKKAYTQKKQEEGDDDCAPFWEESLDLQGLLNGLQDAIDSIGEFLSNPGSFFEALLNSAADRLKQMVDALIEELTKGICERLSQSFLMGKLQDAAEDKIKEQTGIKLNLSKDNIMEQIMDKTICRRGGEVDELLNYGSKSCDLLGDPNDPSAKKAREGKAKEMVDDQLDKFDEYLWGK